MSSSCVIHLKPLLKQVARVFQLPVFQVEERLSEPHNLQELELFRRAGGPTQILICRDPESIISQEEAWDGSGLCVSRVGSIRIESKGVILLKSSEGLELTSSNVEKEVLVRWAIFAFLTAHAPHASFSLI